MISIVSKVKIHLMEQTFVSSKYLTAHTQPIEGTRRPNEKTKYHERGDIVFPSNFLDVK